MPSCLSSFKSNTRSHCTPGNGSTISLNSAARSGEPASSDPSNCTALISTLPFTPLDFSIRRAMLASETFGRNDCTASAVPPTSADTVSAKPVHRPAAPKCSHASNVRKSTRNSSDSAAPEIRNRALRDQRNFCAVARRR